MKKKDASNYVNPISAVLPMYDKNGNNICQVIYTNGRKETIMETLDKFLMQWAAYSFNVNLPHQRSWARSELSISNNVPLVMSEDTVLFPIKTRKVAGLKDGCCGYIHKNCVKDFDDHHIYLHNGIKIPYSSTKKTLNTKINQAKQLRLTYKDQFTSSQKACHNARDGDINKEILKHLQLCSSILVNLVPNSR